MNLLVPSGPVVFEKNQTSTTGIKLSWKPIPKQFWNGEQVTFKIDVLRIDTTEKKKNYSTEKTSAIIAGLQPNTTYNVTVLGSTPFGDFDCASSITLRTKQSKY